MRPGLFALSLGLCAALGCARARTRLPARAGAGSQLARLHVIVSDPDSKQPIACKLLLKAADGAHTPHYGEQGMVGEWLAPRVLGTGDAVYGDPCDLELTLPPGAYHVQASQGIEREIAGADVQLQAAATQTLALALPRAFDSTGIACADFHVHSAPSFDSRVPLDQRLISAVAEGLDAIAPTDHDALGDWDAALARSEMADELTVVLGDEVTPDQWQTPQALGHFGIFPIPRDFHADDYEVPWDSAGSLLARLDSLYPDSVIQVNHPRWDPIIGYFAAGGFDPRDPTKNERLGLAHLDAIELWNSHEFDVEGGPSIETLLQDYYALLDMGVALVATGNTDTHELSRQPLGYPRNCIAVRDDHHPGLTPDDVIEGLRLGKVFVTSGPWLTVSFAGHGPGEMAQAGADPELDISVEAASWVPVDRVHVVVNGQTVQTLPTPSLPVHMQVRLELPRAVSYIMVLAEGDAPLPNVAGTLNAAPQRSYAFTNPIWVEAPTSPP